MPDRETQPTARPTPVPPGEIPAAGFAAAARRSPGAAAAAPLAALPEGSELPVLVTRVDPQYPEAARRLRVGGDVVLRVVVEANGSIGRIETVAPAPFGMTEAAVDAVRKWTYRPARVSGQPVAVWKVIRVKFSPQRRARAASGLSARTYNRAPLMPLMELVYEVEGQTRRYLLSGEDVSIGRSSENGIVLNDFSVSRKHALLSERGRDVDDRGPQVDERRSR